MLSFDIRLQKLAKPWIAPIIYSSQIWYFGIITFVKLSDDKDILQNKINQGLYDTNINWID